MDTEHTALCSGCRVPVAEGHVHDALGHRRRRGDIADVNTGPPCGHGDPGMDHVTPPPGSFTFGGVPVTVDPTVTGAWVVPGETCRVCGGPVRVMAFQRTGACCGRHLDELRRYPHSPHGPCAVCDDAERARIVRGGTYLA